MPDFGALKLRPVVALEAEAMPFGYELIYTATTEAPYWEYRFGVSPVTSTHAGNVLTGARLYLQRPASTSGLGTHQSAYVDGVGRIVMRVADLQMMTCSSG
jgi:hypothetical protein